MKSGNHSNTHPHVNNLTYERNMEEVKICSDLVESLTGNKTTLYRAPYGEYNDIVLEAAMEKNHKTIQWNIDTLDYTGLNSEQMITRINRSLDKGSIILMHNGTKYTKDSLEAIINNIKEKGFEVVKVSDLIYHENYTIEKDGTQKAI